MKWIAVFVLKAYKFGISPMLPPACRFIPTCSEYMAEAIARFGFWRGAWMGLQRLLRCHPFHPGGYDPVPLMAPGDLSLQPPSR